MTDPIADMFTRIRNASLVHKQEVVMPMSKIKYEIAKILEKEGWIKGVEIISGGLHTRHSQFDQIKLFLKYQKSGKSHINAINRISKSGARVYVAKDKMPVVLNNFGIAILSTSAGLMTNKEARRQNIGGEVLGEVY